MALSFTEALPLIQQQTGNQNIIDALALYNQGAFTAPATPVPTLNVSPVTAEAPQNFLNLTSPAPATPSPAAPVQTGIAALPISGPAYDPTKITNLQSLYEYALGRKPDVSGKNYWAEIESGGISPEEYQRFMQVAQPELQVQKAYQDVLGRKFDIPGLEYYTGQLSKGTMQPTDIKSALAYGAQNLADQLAAQKYLGKDIFDTPENLRKSYQQDFSDILSETFGTQAEIEAFEKAAKLAPGTIASTYQPGKYEVYSPEDIQKMLQESTINRQQEANRLAGLAQRLYGYTPEQAGQLYGTLIQGKTPEDQGIASIYKSLLTEGFSPEVRSQIYTDALKKNPNSEFFKNNPDLKSLYTPIEETKSLKSSSGQYGVDKNGMPYLSLDVAKNMVGDGVFIGQGAFRRPVEGKDRLGIDLQGGHIASVRNGVGLYGVTADKKQIDEFDKIQKEIDRLGGLKTDEDGQQYVTRKVSDPESGEMVEQKFSIYDLFQSDPEIANGWDRYQYFKDTQDRLDAAAKNLGVDPSAFKSIKEQYDVLNLLTKDDWAVTTRNDPLDKEALKKAGAKEPGKENQYSTIRYVAQGDKLVPVGVIREFDYKDPNTTRGVAGDFFTSVGELASAIPFGAEIITAGVTAINPAAAPYVYAALKGSQTYAATGDPTKGLVTAGITYFAPKVAGKISSGIEDLLPKDISPGVKSYIVKTGTEAAMSAGIAALQNRDAGQAAASAVINSMFKNVGGKADIPGIPPEYQQIVKQILFDAAMKKDVQKSVEKTITQYGINTLIKSTKEEGKKDKAEPTTVAAAP